MGIIFSCCKDKNDPVFRLNPRESEKIATSLLPSIPAFQFVNEANDDETDTTSSYSEENQRNISDEEIPKLL